MSICGKGYRLCYDSVACRLCQTLQQQTERRCHLQGTEARLKNEEPSRGFLVGHVKRTELALRKGQDLESSEDLPLHHFFTRYLFYFILKYVNEKRILTELRWPVKCFLASHVDFCSINFNW